MGVPKICGIETEYGIVSHGGGSDNPMVASSVLINSYIATLDRPIRWDFVDETPGNDARGTPRAGAMPPEVETGFVNAVLTNGARLYVDHAHPEYSSPECENALVATRFDVAGEIILRTAMEAAALGMPGGDRIVVYKNNSDGKGNSYGCHENYLMDRAVPFSDIAAQIMPFFVTRQLFCGAGKVGEEGPGASARGTTSGDPVGFQLSQRADFIEETIGLETTVRRPIVNTRDEPHGDSERYRRLHVIVGDANMSQFATYLKLGTTCYVLAMIEAGLLADNPFALADPIRAVRAISRDITLRESVELESGKTIRPIDMQREYLQLAKRYAEDVGYDLVGGEKVGASVLSDWESTLHDLDTDPMRAKDRVDWVAKYYVVDGYRQRKDLKWGAAALKAMDLQYHDIRPDKSLAARLGLRGVLDESEAERAVREPPSGTRAYFRGKCIERWGAEIAAANWDSLLVDLHDGPLRRIPMMDPLRGTAEIVDELLRTCDSLEDLVSALGA